jgi:hypothetical protein
MTERPKGQAGDGDPARDPSPAKIWQDWVTIWQSELNAMGTDREVQAAWAKLVSLWAQGARAAAAFLPDGAPGRARPEPPAGPAAPAAAPDARDAALERLAKRVEELERRLAGFLGDGDDHP